MALIYKDISALINNAKWKVDMDDSAELKVPYYYQKYPERKPFFNPIGEMARTSITIHQIVNMCNNNVVFAICNRKDLISIYTYLQKYTEILERNIDGLSSTHPHSRYLKKCKVALDTLDSMANIAKDQEKKQSEFKPMPQITDILKVIG